MKPISRIITVLLAAAALAYSQEQVSSVTSKSATTQATPSASIIDPISDGTPSPPAPKPAPFPFEVLKSLTKRVHVVESPEMPGLPAPEGDINVTFEVVKDPCLVDPLPPLPALPPDDPAVIARITELSAKYPETQLVFVSATVYNHSRTLLHLYPNGNTKKEISAWSNLDFNHFSGFATYQVKNADSDAQEYGLLMGIGNEDTKQTAADLANDYGITKTHEIPDLAIGGPAYIITEGDTTDQEGTQLLQGMHDLYRAEGPRMAAAYQARIKAYEARKAYLLANPPVPTDAKIQIWKRNSPSPIGLKNLTQGYKK